MYAHPYIFLTDTQGNIIERRDGYPGFSSTVTTELDPGTYLIIATTHGDSPDNYTLTVSGPVATLMAGRQLQETDFLVVGQVKDPSGNPIQNVDVTVENDNATQCGGVHKTSTNANGAFALGVDSQSLPRQSVMSLSGDAILDQSINLSINPDNIGVRLDTLAAQPQSQYQVEIDSPPALIHLGDNNFSGAINSRFQKSSQGLTQHYIVDLNSNLFVQPTAEISLVGKGFQSDNKLTINDEIVGYLNSAPSDGSFGRMTFAFPTSYLNNGSNFISIESVFAGGSDYDDFEYQNIILDLSP